MPNWWLQWAERIALVLAEWWMRSRSDGASAPPVLPTAPDEPVPEAPPPVPAPDPGADAHQR